MTNTGFTGSPGEVLFDIDGTLVDSSYVHINASVYEDCQALLYELGTSPLAAVWC